MLGRYPPEMVQYSYYQFCRNTAIIPFCVPILFFLFVFISLSTSTFDIPTANLLMFIFFIFSQEVSLWHLVPLLVKCHRCVFISIVFGFKRSSSCSFRVGIILFFFFLIFGPHPNLIWAFLPCLSQRDRSRLYPLPCQHTYSWEQAQLKHTYHRV